MSDDEDGIELMRLAPDEEPDRKPHVVVLQALSGEYRVVLTTEHSVEMSKPPDDGTNPREDAIRQARRLAGELGLATIYLREDA